VRKCGFSAPYSLAFEQKLHAETEYEQQSALQYLHSWRRRRRRRKGIGLAHRVKRFQ
jgi:hypothetical protein